MPQITCNILYSTLCDLMMLCSYTVPYAVSYYHQVNIWFLGATNGNQGQTMM